MNSLTGPVQIDTSLFINNTNSFVGSYEVPVAATLGSPKVASITAAVSLHAIAVFTGANIEDMLKNEIQTVERAAYRMESNADNYKVSKAEYDKTLHEMWRQFEQLLIDSCMKFREQLTEAKLADKAAFFAECRPVVYTQFKVDDAYVGYTTNMCIEKDENGTKLLFRKPNMNFKRAFDTGRFSKIRE